MSNYESKDIVVLDGLDAVRLRPGMYIGTTGAKGLHHILWEIVDNAIDEISNGFGNKITITLEKDGSATVEDNGRGIPVDIHPTEKKSGVEVVFTAFRINVGITGIPFFFPFVVGFQSPGWGSLVLCKS